MASDPLTLWNDGDVKSAIIDFVQRTTTEGSDDFLTPTERLAVFDNDGTLWVEQPMYTQVAFALDRVHEMADSHPEWKNEEPFKSILANDIEGALAGGMDSLVKLIGATHTGMTTDEFHETVEDWISTATHPTLNRPYYEAIFSPQLELISYLRDNGFLVYIVSGGGIDFMRVFSEKVYGIPPYNVIGSAGIKQFEIQNGKPVLVAIPKLDYISDEKGKPVAIHQFLGQIPAIAVGNSDGDYEMLQYVTTASGPRLGLIVHHDDGDREFAYDRETSFGKLDKGLDNAADFGWHLHCRSPAIRRALCCCAR